jgi:hypothetical protein
MSIARSRPNLATRSLRRELKMWRPWKKRSPVAEERPRLPLNSSLEQDGNKTFKKMGFVWDKVLIASERETELTLKWFANGLFFLSLDQTPSLICFVDSVDVVLQARIYKCTYFVRLGHLFRAGITQNNSHTYTNGRKQD